MAKKNIYIKSGRTDMRRGIEGLAMIVAETGLDPFDKSSMFLFCGKRKDRYKVLTWNTEGFSMTYTRWESGTIKWPKNEDEPFIQISKKQLSWLLDGLFLSINLKQSKKL